MVALLLVGCRSESTPAPPFPIPVGLDAGPVLIGISTGDDDAGYGFAVVDTLSPLTVVDDSAARGQPPRTPARRRMDLTLYGLDESGAVPQVLLSGAGIWDLHPCDDVDENGAARPCTLGLEGQTRELQAILGADLLARGAARFAFAAARMFLLPDVPGDNQDRACLCEAVFPAPFHGGGTMVVSGAEVSYRGQRIALGACVYQDAAAAPAPVAGMCVAPDTGSAPDAGPAPDAGMPQDAGVMPDAATPPSAYETLGLDGLFLLSTGLPVTLVSERFYHAYEAFAGAPPLADLAPETLHLPFGSMRVRMGELRNLALVSETSEERGPCMERYANTCMRTGTCDTSDGGCRDCDTQCRASAAVDLAGPFPVAVISDAEPLLQALRDELRPSLPEIDGILAPSALMPLVLDVDYPHNRVLVRCVSDGCVAQPSLVASKQCNDGASVPQGASCIMCPEDDVCAGR